MFNLLALQAFQALEIKYFKKMAPQVQTHTFFSLPYRHPSLYMYQPSLHKLHHMIGNELQLGILNKQMPSLDKYANKWKWHHKCVK